MHYLTSRLRWFALALWATAVAAGLAYAWNYEATPGISGAAHEHWPTGTACTLASDRPTLVMFVHPHCPCSRASLDELAVLLTHCRDRFAAEVVFVQPASLPPEWSHTDLWNSAASLPGVATQIDAGGVEQRRFGAQVSGEVFVYLPDGELLFHGGITGSRGHVGDNVGRAALESYLLRGVVAARSTPIFGCSLGPVETRENQTASAPLKAKP